MDFLTVPTATFRLLYVWFAIRHGRREIVHWSVTENPTATWIIQQLREAFPFDAAASGSRYLVFDRDAIFSAEVVAAIVSMAIDRTRTSHRSPWQNGVAGRFVGSVRRELLDHAIILDDRHLSAAYSASTSPTTSRTVLILGSERTRRWLGPSSRARRDLRPSEAECGSAGCTTGGFGGT